jgi:hypothetical protein
LSQRVNKNKLRFIQAQLNNLATQQEAKSQREALAIGVIPQIGKYQS